MYASGREGKGLSVTSHMLAREANGALGFDSLHSAVRAGGSGGGLSHVLVDSASTLAPCPIGVARDGALDTGSASGGLLGRGGSSGWGWGRIGRNGSASSSASSSASASSSSSCCRGAGGWRRGLSRCLGCS